MIIVSFIEEQIFSLKYQFPTIRKKITIYI